ncbi:hypothetical protein CEXT_494241 [Caerostris extrusa]|uniref:Uncharacterized protein n=1 Tax=Caerostris extrusa TaxID=172846 RepID=A0AAV4YD68_CAEEX|nr:hypothetical protein CEXT_494241 [Caerostris extrusa]
MITEKGILSAVLSLRCGETLFIAENLECYGNMNLADICVLCDLLETESDAIPSIWPKQGMQCNFGISISSFVIVFLTGYTAGAS